MRRRPIRWAIEPLRRYAAFSGRSCRSEFWWFWLLITVVNTVLDAVADLAKLPVLSSLVSLAFVLPELAVCARRLHDIGRSAWWLLMPFAAAAVLFAVALYHGSAGDTEPSSVFGESAPILLAVLLIFATLFVLFGWFCKAGTAASNLYGPDPLDPGADLAEVFR